MTTVIKVLRAKIGRFLQMQLSQDNQDVIPDPIYPQNANSCRQTWRRFTGHLSIWNV